MQKVISINLNGHAYQLEEGGYEALRAYLAAAERDLATNPDRAEILTDLEQAIADRCQAFLGPHKSVVTAGEVEQIVAAMGPVDAAHDATATGGTGGSGPAGADPARRLYRIPDGEMIAGVCNGLAAYFAIDVKIVRIGFVATALFTKGVGVLGYVIMMFVVPEATTPEERAAAGSAPVNAKEVVDRAAKQAAAGANQVRVAWLRQQRRWRRRGRRSEAHARVPSPIAAALAAVFAAVHLVLFFAVAAALVSLVNHEEVLGWELDPGVPVWAAALILLIGYQIAVTPLRAAAAAPWARDGAWPGYWSAAIWLVGLAAALWMAPGYWPEIQEFIRRVPELFREMVDAVRERA
ncbi:MAG: PspC domain-containing protein [Acidobacteriota bacterium]|nr:PspC domain-containing protein [Acidobacteriota bacterium]